MLKFNTFNSLLERPIFQRLLNEHRLNRTQNAEGQYHPANPERLTQGISRSFTNKNADYLFDFPSFTFNPKDEDFNLSYLQNDKIVDLLSSTNDPSWASFWLAQNVLSSLGLIEYKLTSPTISHSLNNHGKFESLISHLENIQHFIKNKFTNPEKLSTLKMRALVTPLGLTRNKATTLLGFPMEYVFNTGEGSVDGNPLLRQDSDLKSWQLSSKSTWQDFLGDTTDKINDTPVSSKLYTRIELAMRAALDSTNLIHQDAINFISSFGNKIDNPELTATQKQVYDALARPALAYSQNKAELIKVNGKTELRYIDQEPTEKPNDATAKPTTQPVQQPPVEKPKNLRSFNQPVDNAPEPELDADDADIFNALFDSYQIPSQTLRQNKLILEAISPLTGYAADIPTFVLARNNAINNARIDLDSEENENETVSITDLIALLKQPGSAIEGIDFNNPEHVGKEVAKLVGNNKIPTFDSLWNQWAYYCYLLTLAITNQYEGNFEYKDAVKLQEMLFVYSNLLNDTLNYGYNESSEGPTYLKLALQKFVRQNYQATLTNNIAAILNIEPGQVDEDVIHNMSLDQYCEAFLDTFEELKHEVTIKDIIKSSYDNDAINKQDFIIVQAYHAYAELAETLIEAGYTSGLTMPNFADFVIRRWNRYNTAQPYFSCSTIKDVRERYALLNNGEQLEENSPTLRQLVKLIKGVRQAPENYAKAVKIVDALRSYYNIDNPEKLREYKTFKAFITDLYARNSFRYTGTSRKRVSSNSDNSVLYQILNNAKNQIKNLHERIDNLAVKTERLQQGETAFDTSKHDRRPILSAGNVYLNSFLTAFPVAVGSTIYDGENNPIPDNVTIANFSQVDPEQPLDKQFFFDLIHYKSGAKSYALKKEEMYARLEPYIVETPDLPLKSILKHLFLECDVKVGSKRSRKTVGFIERYKDYIREHKMQATTSRGQSQTKHDVKSRTQSMTDGDTLRELKNLIDLVLAAQQYNFKINDPDCQDLIEMFNSWINNLNDTNRPDQVKNLINAYIHSQEENTESFIDSNIEKGVDIRTGEKPHISFVNPKLFEYTAAMQIHRHPRQPGFETAQNINKVYIPFFENQFIAAYQHEFGETISKDEFTFMTMTNDDNNFIFTVTFDINSTLYWSTRFRAVSFINSFLTAINNKIELNPVLKARGIKPLFELSSVTTAMFNTVDFNLFDSIDDANFGQFLASIAQYLADNTGSEEDVLKYFRSPQDLKAYNFTLAQVKKLRKKGVSEDEFDSYEYFNQYYTKYADKIRKQKILKESTDFTNMAIDKPKTKKDKNTYKNPVDECEETIDSPDFIDDIVAEFGTAPRRNIASEPLIPNSQRYPRQYRQDRWREQMMDQLSR